MNSLHWNNIKDIIRQKLLWFNSFLSQLFKSIWLFFPGILFLLLSIVCFWLTGQGKDFIVAFTENGQRDVQMGAFLFKYTRIVFFLAIAFWVYVSWYSSRVICYIKRNIQTDSPKNILRDKATSVSLKTGDHPDIYSTLMENFPRMIGNACFLVLELAILQSPLIANQIKPGLALKLLFALIVVFYFLNRLIEKHWAKTVFFRKLFYWMLFIFLAALLALSISPSANSYVLLIYIILLHAIFIVYINLRRSKMNAQRQAVPVAKPLSKIKIFSLYVMDKFCIPHEELGYYKWFLYIGFSGLAVYVLSINSLHAARIVGPFPFIILGFTVLLAFGNIITALSIKAKINVHFILFLMALFFSFGETHSVRTVAHSKPYGRPDLEKYLRAWLQERSPSSDTAAIHMYFIMSNGGASRSGYWTATVLGRLEDSTLTQARKFSQQVFCLSGTSGGGVGVAAYFSVLSGKQTDTVTSGYESSLRTYLKKDYFTYTFARLLGPDFFNYVFHIHGKDRAAALESSFEMSGDSTDGHFYVPFDSTFSFFRALNDNNKINLPILCINTTRMQDGNPGVVSNLDIDSLTFNSRVDVVKLLANEKRDFSLASGAILGARFPFLSPAGNIANNYFVDGGYFDNSGAGVVQELIRGIINIGKKARGNNDPIAGKIARIHFHVVHVVNSPETVAADLKAVPPIKNDLLAPVLTILGAYDMQTTVNDERLINYLNDLNRTDSNSFSTHADYRKISLYKTGDELKAKPSEKELPYAMNWFISDSTALRIDKRLIENDSLKLTLEDFKKNQNQK